MTGSAEFAQAMYQTINLVKSEAVKAHTLLLLRHTIDSILYVQKPKLERDVAVGAIKESPEYIQYCNSLSEEELKNADIYILIALMRT